MSSAFFRRQALYYDAESRRESVLTFWIGILKSAELLKADVAEKENRIFKGRGSEQELSTSII